MIRWMLLSTLATGLFYGLYCLTLRRDRWLQLSRAYLIILLAFSLMFPIVRLPEKAMLPALTLPEVAIGAAGESAVWAGESPAYQNALAGEKHAYQWIYLVGLVATLAWLAVSVGKQAARLWKIMSQTGSRHTRLHLLDDDTPSYSFFNHIVVGTRGLGDDELRTLLAHEEEHVRQGHTVDVLFVRLLCCIAWFNPFAWLMLRELMAVHEYEADAASLGACGREDYLRLLYRQATGFGYGHITNNFNSINIKNRIVMMNKTKTRFGAWKVLATLPVAALLLMVGCKPAADKTDVQEEIPFASDGVNQSAPLDASTDEVFLVVEVDPEYPGGIEALYKYLAENIKYPEKAKSAGAEGRVIVSFVVEKDGSVTDAKVLRSVSDEIDAEALRVVNAMPQWKPGMQQGTPVRVQYNLPINFKLQ